MSNFQKNNFNPSGGGNRPERIRIDARCPVCGSMYDFGRLEIIQEEEGATLMYIKCTICQSAALSLVALGSYGLKVASTLTDMEQREVRRFQDSGAVRAEDVLAVHELFSDDERAADFIKTRY